MGGMTSWEFVSVFGEPLAAEPSLPVYNFSVSVFFASGFFLTELWFRLRARLEARFRLIAEVDRELIGLLEESRIVEAVCEILARGKGYRLASIGAAEDDGAIRVVRSAGAARESLGRWALRWDESPEGSQPVGIALRTREPFVA